MAELRGSTVTFLFTDIEGSTRLVRQLRDRYAEVLAEHQRLLREAFRAHAGDEIDTQGDSFFVAFPRARDAVLAAIEAQRALASHDWPEGVPVRVRMGIHTGGAAVAADRYLGLAVHRAARICSAGHGGQVLVSQTTQTLLEDEEEDLDGASLRDLGPQRLKDLDRPVHLYQLVAPGLAKEFPPLKTLDAAPFTGRERELAQAAKAAVQPRHVAMIALARRRRLLLVLAAALVAGAVAAVVATLGSGSKPLTVPPNAVGAIDPRGDRVVAAIPVGATPAALATGAGAVWVVNAGEQTLSRIDPVSRSEVKRIGAVAKPTSVTVADGSVWVATQDHDVARVDPQTNGVGRPLALSHRSNPLLTLESPSWVAAGRVGVWASAPGVVERVGPLPQRTIPVDACCGVIAAGNDAVWVAVHDGVEHLRPGSGSRSLVHLNFEPTALAVAPGAVWAANAAGDAVWRVDPATDQPLASVHVPHPVGVAVGAGAVWAASTDGIVARIDPTTSPPVVTRTIRVGNTPHSVTVGDGLVWVSVD